MEQLPENRAGWSPRAVPGKGLILPHVCWPWIHFISPFLPSSAPPAGVPGGSEAESTREAEAEERAARESQGCQGGGGAVRGDTCIVTHSDRSLTINNNMRPLCSCVSALRHGRASRGHRGGSVGLTVGPGDLEGVFQPK